MNSTTSPETVPSINDRAPGGRFAKGNAGGPGNPFARQTAALRAYLIEHVTERDLQDILDILLLNAKGGHLPTIKLLFSYILGKPKPVVEPDLLDLQEMLMLQQAKQVPEALTEMCDQLPLDFQVQLTRHAQAENVAAVVQTARDNQAAAIATSPSEPSTNGDLSESPSPASVDAPSTDGAFGTSTVAEHQKAPSINGETRRRSRPPKLAGFDWLAELRRASGGRAGT
jgi:hypothetical protein